MRGTALGRAAATVVTFAVASVMAVAGSQAAENTQPQLAAASTAAVSAAAVSAAAVSAAAGLATAGTFRSVRSDADVADVAEPVGLRIPVAGVDTALVRLGSAADGSIEVPARFDVAGWFAEGPRPGQPGPAVVLGHVDSRTGPAVFYRVAALPRDAQLIVDRRTGVRSRAGSAARGASRSASSPPTWCTGRHSSPRSGW